MRLPRTARLLSSIACAVLALAAAPAFADNEDEQPTDPPANEREELLGARSPARRGRGCWGARRPESPRSNLGTGRC